MAVAVLSKYGERLMPTVRYGKVRHMLKDGRAVIVKHDPFTIQLTYETTTNVQPMEICVDPGYQHVGISVKSASREYVSEQRDLLPDEKERHDAQRKYRRNRRSRKRYRKPRFDNRKRKEGQLAPSLQHKEEAQARLVERYATVMPLADIFVEVAQFDTARLKAIEEGTEIPEGEDYQHGPKYNLETLREAVFVRDKHTCRICGRSSFDPKDKAILHAHHALYWKGRYGNSVSELLSVCEKCHIHANHAKGGVLWGLTPKVAQLEGAAFMNAVRWQLVEDLKQFGIPVHVTYGAETKAMRKMLKLEKSHINDAYAMGNFHPEIRASMEHWEKRRRNNRCLEKFYDAKFYDLRIVNSDKALQEALRVLEDRELAKAAQSKDAAQKKAAKEKIQKAKTTLKKAVVPGQTLFCGRSYRNKNLNTEDLTVYRGKKISKGYRSIRRARYPLQPGDVVCYGGKRHAVKGCHSYGTRVILDNGKSVKVEDVTTVYHASGWKRIS